MDETPVNRGGLPVAAATAIASSALIVPIMMSLSTTPSPNHPRIMAWYLSLRQPGFKPPDKLIPIAWTGIEASLAVAGYRLLRRSSSTPRTKALAWWAWNIFMIGGWSRMFFKGNNLAASTAAAAALTATSIAFVSQAKEVDRTAARAGLPLAGWVAFATVLTATIWYLNPRKRR